MARTLTLPFVTLQFRMPRLRSPDVRLPSPRVSTENNVGAAVKSVRPALLPPGELAYYGGLGLMAVFGLVEWPVAGVLAFGTMIARAGRESSQARARGSGG